MNAGIELFEPDRHEAVTQTEWDPQEARKTIAILVSDVVASRDENGQWLDNYGAHLSLYAGAAGIYWTSRELQHRGFLAQTIDLDLGHLPETGPLWDDYPGVFDEHKVPVSTSFLMGPVGVLMTRWQMTRDPQTLGRLDTLIGENQSHPWMENLWGAPSTMVAASHLYEATGQERFADHIRSGADYMWQRLEDSDNGGCKIWNIALYGSQFKFTGAGHGFVGNVFPVLKNLLLFDEETRAVWVQMIVNTVRGLAIRQDGMTNWPGLADWPEELPRKMVLHHCHGAPGFVIGLMSLFGQGHDDFDELMLLAGDLIWHAGPLKKYPGLCHGTPGNGYAFLKLWKATGDAKWLDRARAFAMSAIEQRATRLEAGGKSESSLWDGDMGLALYLADCIEEKSEFPTMDYF